MRSIWVAARVIREISRDRRTLAFFFLAPIIIMTLVYYAIKDDQIAKIGVVTRGAARFFEMEFLNTLENDKDVRIVNLSISDEETDPQTLNRMIRKELAAGRVDGVLYMSEQMLNERFAGNEGTLHLYVEGSKPIVTSAVFGAIADAMDELAASLPVVIDSSCSSLCAESVNNKPMELKKHYLYGDDDYRTVDFFLPVLPAFFVFFFTFILSTITFQRERLRGTLERLLVAPVGFYQVIAGYVMGFFIFASLQSIIVVVYILKLIQFQFTWRQTMAFAVVILLTMLVALNLGLLASFLAHNEFQALQFIPLVILPQIFLADIIWDINGFPMFFQIISKLFPLTHANAAARDIMIRGNPLSNSWMELLILAGFIAIVFTVMSLVAHKKDKSI
ncbi:MAG: ABC transporter permease [Nitrospinota bacterium]|nr:ABC transporter permease [Nitrospinota bacterium]